MEAPIREGDFGCGNVAVMCSTTIEVLGDFGPGPQSARVRLSPLSARVQPRAIGKRFQCHHAKTCNYHVQRNRYVQFPPSSLLLFEFNPNSVLLYIHRNFFARALLDFPTNPLRSPFAPSFLAAYRSATQLLKTLRENFDAFSYLFIRLWPIWAHALASSVSFHFVVCDAPFHERL